MTEEKDLNKRMAWMGGKEEKKVLHVWKEESRAFRPYIYHPLAVPDLGPPHSPGIATMQRLLEIGYWIDIDASLESHHAEQTEQ